MIIHDFHEPLPFNVVGLGLLLEQSCDLLRATDVTGITQNLGDTPLEQARVDSHCHSETTEGLKPILLATVEPLHDLDESMETLVDPMFFLPELVEISVDLRGGDLDHTTQTHSYKYFFLSHSCTHSRRRQVSGTTMRHILRGLSKNFPIFPIQAFEYMRMQFMVSSSMNSLNRTDSDGWLLVIFFSRHRNSFSRILLLAFILLMPDSNCNGNYLSHVQIEQIYNECPHLLKLQEMLSPALTMTLLTTLTFLLGLISTVQGSLLFVVVAFAITFLLPMLIPRFNHMLPNQIFQCVLTTFIFGVVDAYYWNNFVLPSGHYDAFAIFVWMSTIRYYGEFQLINNFHHHELQWQSFLIYHSKPYMITNVILIIEHVLTRHVFDLGYKESHFLMVPALIISLAAMVLRIMAFFTAKSNFTHKVSSSKKVSHKLVTNGVYSIFRHPSYTGFFYYTVASMVLIGNFVSAILFGLMLSVFFDDRISYEEHYLLKFFGDQYDRYRKSTHVFIPYLPEKIKKRLPDIGG